MEELTYFESTFAVTTLAFDVQVNPWQSSLNSVFDTPCLLDAVRTLAQRHRAHCTNTQEGLEVLMLKARALSTFAENLRVHEPEALISTVLTLIGLEVSQLGLGARLTRSFCPFLRQTIPHALISPGYA